MTTQANPGRTAAPGSPSTSISTPPNRDELARGVTYELQPVIDALISLGVAASSARKAARSVIHSDSVKDVAAAWACHATLLSECVSLVETRTNVLIEAVQQLIRAR